MEQNLQRRVAGLKDKLPDIQKTLETVRFLKLREVGQGTTFHGGIELTMFSGCSPSQTRSRLRLS